MDADITNTDCEIRRLRCFLWPLIAAKSLQSKGLWNTIPLQLCPSLISPFSLASEIFMSTIKSSNKTAVEEKEWWREDEHYMARGSDKWERERRGEDWRERERRKWETEKEREQDVRTDRSQPDPKSIIVAQHTMRSVSFFFFFYFTKAHPTTWQSNALESKNHQLPTKVCAF